MITNDIYYYEYIIFSMNTSACSINIIPNKLSKEVIGTIRAANRNGWGLKRSNVWAPLETGPQKTFPLSPLIGGPGHHYYQHSFNYQLLAISSIISSSQY